MRLGVFGGTFDPVHIGHLVAAADARDQLELDLVLLVVASQPWQKVDHREVTPAELRFEMVRAAVDGVAGLEASDIEIARGGASYSADTLEELRIRHPGVELFLVVGSDVSDALDTWVRVDDVKRLATLAVVTRAGAAPIDVERLRSSGWRAEIVEIPDLELSSSEIRSRLARGRSVDWLVPAGAIRLIRKTGLYADRR